GQVLEPAMVLSAANCRSVTITFAAFPGMVGSPSACKIDTLGDCHNFPGFMEYQFCRGVLGVCLWNAQTGQFVRKLSREGTVQVVAFSSDNKTLFIGGTEPNSRGFFLEQWDANRLKFLKNHSFYIPIRSMVFSPDGKAAWVVPSLEDHSPDSISLLNLETGK